MPRQAATRIAKRPPSQQEDWSTAGWGCLQGCRRARMAKGEVVVARRVCGEMMRHRCESLLRPTSCGGCILFYSVARPPRTCDVWTVWACALLLVVRCGVCVCVCVCVLCVRATDRPGTRAHGDGVPRATHRVRIARGPLSVLGRRTRRAVDRHRVRARGAGGGCAVVSGGGYVAAECWVVYRNLQFQLPVRFGIAPRRPRRGAARDADGPRPRPQRFSLAVHSIRLGLRLYAETKPNKLLVYKRSNAKLEVERSSRRSRSRRTRSSKEGPPGPANI